MKTPDISNELKNLKLPADFVSTPLTSPLSVGDVMTSFVDNLKDTHIYGQVLRFVNKMREGDLNSIVIAGATMIVGSMIMYRLFFDDSDTPTSNVEKVDDDKKEIELRDFTIAQLRDFDGQNEKPIYIALKGDVFDVSSAQQFYGEGSGYNCFAGRDATRAMAKLSFDEVDLANSNVDDLGPFELDVLNDWYSKFRDYKCYPIIGKVSIPTTGRNFTCAELAASKEDKTIPKGRVDTPLLVGINGKVIDVSYGGKEMYGHDGPYNLFVGIDASRALAKMSFKEEDLNSRELTDITPEQQKTLVQWEEKFINVRKYPVVGQLVP